MNTPIVLGPGEVVDSRTNHLANVRLLAKAMDSSFVIPGTQFRFGLDALIGLIPGIGDAIGSLVGLYIVFVASEMGVSKAVLARMILNLGADAVVGAVPLAGDVLDAAWRANMRNVALLEAAIKEPRAAQRSSIWMFVGAVMIALALFAGGLFLTVFLAKLAWNAVG